MYGGRPGYGGQLPYALSELPYSLGEVSSSGYGPYLGERDNAVYNLGNIFDDIAKVAGKVGIVSGELGKVASGQATVATIPTGQATLTIPVPGSPVSAAIPLWVVGAAAAGLLFVALRPRRRR